MSKLRDRIRRLGRVDGAAIGFARAVAARPSAALLLLVRTDGNGGGVEEALEGGADGVIVAGGTPPRRVDGKDIWWGMVAAGPLPEDIPGTGADFIVAGVDAPPAALLSEGVALVIDVDEDWPDASLRALAMFSPEAIYVRLGDKISMPRLLELRRLSGLAAPILLEVGPRAELEPSLPLIRDAGVAGIVLTADARGRLAALREQVNKLPPRRQKRAEAVLPRLEAGAEDDDLARGGPQG